jgi:F0F1-type ATP synthase assembly protein I
LDVSQRRELSNDIFHRSSGSFELVLAPLLLGVLGFWIDRRIDTVPLFTILLALAGVTGAAVKIYYGYRYAMAELAAAKAAKRAHEVVGS